MIRYKLRQDIIDYPDEGTFKAYGIDITDTDTNTVVKSIPDICFDRPKLEKLIKDCNELDVELIHIYDIIEDFLP